MSPHDGYGPAFSRLATRFQQHASETNQRFNAASRGRPDVNISNGEATSYHPQRRSLRHFPTSDPSSLPEQFTLPDFQSPLRSHRPSINATNWPSIISTCQSCRKRHRTPSRPSASAPSHDLVFQNYQQRSHTACCADFCPDITMPDYQPSPAHTMHQPRRQSCLCPEELRKSEVEADTPRSSSLDSSSSSFSGIGTQETTPMSSASTGSGGDEWFGAPLRRYERRDYGSVSPLQTVDEPYNPWVEGRHAAGVEKRPRLQQTGGRSMRIADIMDEDALEVLDARRKLG